MSAPGIQDARSPAARRQRLDVGDRGRTVLARKVLEKVAAQIVVDETFAGGSSGGFLGIGARADLSARPQAKVELAGNVASLKVEVGLPYPVPLRQATDQLRDRISSRVSEMTGVEVRQVDVTVSWLRPDEPVDGRRRLQ
ncbi:MULTISPECIES: Asp23/Gls24 family envelope stress response protein [Arthrobacter]|uniref:Asp23/Gls24 family envelope stress response protein n=1 Tax=Arthrobacter sunyaminii TaxID=2816859 RepID=A0A975PEY4_9MICC|nr:MULTISPECIES: Asp23/Gls24 family envelope stress response protein [Arthrobacter]MBO0897066.1 Asp23/Gls24 family envelope stress response protein [Arthrobacter sunyaminii]MBO0909549.1 Asp23/Gls24 family envelope stress response protein [Arthrobacter sunyaminii]QWQ36141.1 Asp23/Gls24 family envelope stress response protein [Arthrobacter sunyaminii]